MKNSHIAKTVLLVVLVLSLVTSAALLCACDAITEKLYVGYTGVVTVGGELDLSLLTVKVAGPFGTRVLSAEEYTVSELDSSTPGTKTVTVTYNGVKVLTATVEIEVVAQQGTLPAKLSSVSARYDGGDLVVGDTLDSSKVTVTALYTDNTSKTVTDWTLSGFDGSVAGEQTVTVTYTEEGVTKSATFTVKVWASPLAAIEVTYTGGDIFVGERIDHSKVQVIASFENNESSPVTNFTLSDEFFENKGTQTVTVSYTLSGVTQTGTFTVNVKGLIPERLDVSYTGGKILLGTQPDPSKLVATVFYTNGTSKIVNVNCGTVDSTETGVKDWEISYSENDVTVTAIVKITVTDSLGPKEPTEAPYDVNVIANEDLSIHFLMLGNKFTGDSVYIKAGETDILIDAGSRYSSASTIINYVNQYCDDGILEYVVATHAHQDHIAGFITGESNGGGVLDKFQVETIITYARKSSTSNVSGYFTNKVNQLKSKGTNVFTALDCVDNANGAQKEFQLADGISMEILDQKYYHQSTDNENNYSVCLMIKQGENNYLFTGDLEGAGERSLAQLNDLPKVKLWKGGHHGSYTAGDATLLQEIQPETICICTCMGTTEYTTTNHIFPAQEFVERVAKYTDRVYCTTDGTQYGSDSDKTCRPANGNIVFACTDEQITMYFSNNNTKLKDTQWFKSNRTCPASWK